MITACLVGTDDRICKRPVGRPRKKYKSEVVCQLTPLQINVLAQRRDGFTIKEIARKRGVVPGTIKNTLTAIFRKLNARNSLEAVNIAVEQGVI